MPFIGKVVLKNKNEYRTFMILELLVL